jgi:hypothetical protein
MNCFIGPRFMENRCHPHPVIPPYRCQTRVFYPPVTPVYRSHFPLTHNYVCTPRYTPAYYRPIVPCNPATNILSGLAKVAAIGAILTL